MKPILHRSLSCLLVLVLALTLAVPAFAADVPVTGVSLDQTSVSIAPGDKLTLKATVTPDSATKKSVTWKSENTRVATVSNKGEVTAVKKGVTNIMVTTDDGAFAALCRVTVEDDYVTGLAISPAGPETLPVGKTHQLTAMATYAHGKTATETKASWSTSDPAIATVSATGLVTTAAEGTVSIFATANGISAAYQLTVSKAGVTSDKDALTLDASAVNAYGGQFMDTTLKAPAAKVLNGTDDVTENYTLTYAWVESGRETLGTGQTQVVRPLTLTNMVVTCTVTATSKTDSTQKLTASCQYTVQILPGTVLGVATTADKEAAPIDKMADLDNNTLLTQLQKGEEGSLTPAIPGLTHVVFDPQSITGSDVGTLSAQAGVAYYLGDTLPEEAAEGSKLLSEVTFTPAKTGTFEIDLLAYGDTTYYGQLEIVVSGKPDVPDPSPEDQLSCSSAGITFAGSDFFNPDDRDPVAAMVFGKPSSGTLIRNFTNGSGTLDEGDKYYTDSAADGDFHISTLTYLPKAGFSGTVTIPVTYTSRNGQTARQDLLIQVKDKNKSDKFVDVTPDTVGNWAANAVDFAYDCGLVNGVDPTHFSPSAPMNRAMLVTILYRAAGSPEVTTTTNFEDLNVGSYYYEAVVWANIMGIVNGTTDTTFSPNAPVTREQIAAILYRYADTMDMGNTYSGNLNAYADRNQVSSYARVPMTWAVSRGIISGLDAQTLSPLTSATRAQVAVMLHRYLAQ